MESLRSLGGSGPPPQHDHYRSPTRLLQKYWRPQHEFIGGETVKQAQAGTWGRAQLGSKTIATEATNQDAQAMHGMSKQARKLTPVDRLAENPDNNAQRGGAQSGRRVGKATQEPAQRALNSDAHRQYLDERR